MSHSCPSYTTLYCSLSYEFHNVRLSTLSNTFSSSRKLMYSNKSHLIDCSTMICSVAIWNVHEHGIRPADLETRELLSLSSSSATLCWKLFLVLTVMWCLCISHICSNLTLISSRSVLLSSLSTLLLPSRFS